MDIDANLIRDAEKLQIMILAKEGKILPTRDFPDRYLLDEKFLIFRLTKISNSFRKIGLCENLNVQVFQNVTYSGQ